ncbi:hypothetical protein HOLleu_18852 [Holothuria leucospilota]|uniref:Uncharacterized protein n=1 Tax=Holothuria leucospilota TaxID=206669 RepID=A0A9Q1C4B6_HOLLE|nr:hypothetical protein HOLleu_18852 [Holothuria leucospilota]
MEGTNQGSTSPNASPNSNTVSVSLSSSSNAPSVAAMKLNVATAAAGGEKTSKESGTAKICCPISKECLQKIRQDRAEGLLVVLNWPTQLWFPLLKQMVVGTPILLKCRETLITQPVSQAPHPLHMIFTVADGTDDLLLYNADLVNERSYVAAEETLVRMLTLNA